MSREADTEMDDWGAQEEEVERAMGPIAGESRGTKDVAGGTAAPE